MPGDAEARGRAWPSPRTWEMALRLLATGYAAGASAEAVAAAVIGAVGDGAGIELVAYLEQLEAIQGLLRGLARHPDRRQYRASGRRAIEPRGRQVPDPQSLLPELAV